MSNQETVEEEERVEPQEEGETAAPMRPREYGGPRGKEPTRYGDWEKNGRCIDF